ncbi:MAG: rod shape-determining protein MreD [Pseudomonadota bacterium]|nr:rod shape-determining protein MreD [Pseudomonadota bacterium]
MNPLMFAIAAMVAAVLSIFRLPNDWYAWLSLWQPQWLLLLLMYWGLQVGTRLGVVWAWLGGFFVDALLAEPLGLNGAIFATLTYLLLRFRERILMYGLVQQAILVFVFVATAQTFRSLCLNFFNNQDWNLLPLTTSLVSAVLWPYVYKLLRALEPKAGLR